MKIDFHVHLLDEQVFRASTCGGNAGRLPGIH
jgi:hypothetical protein